MTKRTAISYERTECTRCGGSGHYSYNQVHGSMCYKCRGSGTQLTKRGMAASKYASELLDVAVEDVPEGGKFVYIDSFKGRGYNFCTAELNEKVGLWDGDGNPVATYRVINAKGEHVNSISARIRVRLHPTPEQVEEVMAYQESLTKAGKPRKR